MRQAIIFCKCSSEIKVFNKRPIFPASPPPPPSSSALVSEFHEFNRPFQNHFVCVCVISSVECNEDHRTGKGDE